jgi:hypothetical protein
VRAANIHRARRRKLGPSLARSTQQQTVERRPAGYDERIMAGEIDGRRASGRSVEESRAADGDRGQRLWQDPINQGQRAPRDPAAARLLSRV